MTRQWSSSVCDRASEAVMELCDDEGVRRNVGTMRHHGHVTPETAGWPGGQGQCGHWCQWQLRSPPLIRQTMSCPVHEIMLTDFCLGMSKLSIHVQSG